MSKFRFQLGDIVYSVVGEHKGMVTGICHRPVGVNYMVTWGHDLAERWHYEFELSDVCQFGVSADEETVTQ